MTTDETLRRAERQGDRAELVRAMVLRITGAHRFTFEDPDAHLGLTTTWLEGNDPNPGWRGDGPQVLARTLDLVEPGDGEQVLAPQHLTAILTPAGHG